MVIVANWYLDAARYLGGVPESYLVFDAETQGKDPDSPSTLPTQLGFALVIDRELVRHGDYCLNWTVGPTAVDEGWFRQTLRDTAAAMADKGKPYHTTWERIVAEGVEPLQGLAEFQTLFRAVRAAGHALVAHNGWSYDRTLLEHAWRRMGLPFEINVEHLVDTGLMEKCYRMGWSPPLPGSCSRGDWYAQVREAPSWVKWSLDGACNEAYKLEARHGLDVGRAHSAGFDAVVTHHLLEAMRERAEEGPDAAYFVDLGEYRFPISKNWKGVKLSDMAADPRGLDSLRWFLQQPFFHEKFANIALTVQAYLVQRGLS